MMSTITAATDESIKLWLKVGNLKKLEQAVLDGYGDQLRGKTSRIPKINKFLKRIPYYQAKIAAIHKAAAQGNVRDLENLLDRRSLVCGRDVFSGGTPLHTAIVNKKENVIEHLLQNYPYLLTVRDYKGRTALHYEAATNGRTSIYDLLVTNGSDTQIKDLLGNTPEDYLSNPQDLQLNRPPEVVINAINNRRQSRDVSSMLRQLSPVCPITKGEVKGLIQKGDIAKLERFILQGNAKNLVGEVAISTRVQGLLESLPEYLAKQASLKVAIENGSLRDVKNLLNRLNMVLARDDRGLTILHRAVIYGHRDIVEYLISINPNAIFAKDQERRSPVHYAAALSDEGEIYDLLMKAGGNISLPDNDGKTPEYYKQNPGNLNLKRILECKSGGSENVTNSNELLVKARTRSGKDIMSSQQRLNSVNYVKQWLSCGDIDKLEKAVLDGHGLVLLRETSNDSKSKAFLRTVPIYMHKINSIHEAVSQGKLRNVKMMLDRKKLSMSKDQFGLGLLHKAIIYEHVDVVKFLLTTYPETLTMKDKLGRTPLHYAAAIKSNSGIYTFLLESGADPNMQDVRGNTPEYYQSNEKELDIEEVLNRINRRRVKKNNSLKLSTSDKPQEIGFNITGGNIRKWIHTEDIAKLEQVVLEGQGYKLLLETSNNPRVKQFLVSVPALVNKIREVHGSVVSGALLDVEFIMEKPTLLLSKDEIGMSPLHKAVLLKRGDFVEFILKTCPSSLGIKDEEGRTALHYAAGLKDDGEMYKLLVEAGADEKITDDHGKSPEHYLKHSGELEIRQLLAHVNRSKLVTPKKQDSHIIAYSTKRQAVNSTLRPVRKMNSAVSNEAIKRLIQSGDTEKLEQLVLDGYGKRLIGKSSWNEEIRGFLKKVPQYMDKIYAIHTAAATGDVAALQQLLDRKKMVMAKDEYGLTALHKAVKYGQTDVVKYLLQTFPASHTVKDQDGRTALHYAALYNNRDDIYNILVASGADPKAQDQRGRSSKFYMDHSTKLEPPPPPKPLVRMQTSKSISDNQVIDEQPDSSDEDEKQIDIWIQRGELEELQKCINNGNGAKLLGKSSSKRTIQEFLESVPTQMGKIRAIHNAATSGDLKDVQTLVDSDAMAVSLDVHGACPLHKAVLHGHKDVMKFLANTYPVCLNVQDKCGLTPLHYAALIGGDGLLYRVLSNCGCDPNIKDNNGNTAGQILRGKASVSIEELFKRYEEKKVPPRPLSVQMWERPPTEELLRALTPSPSAKAVSLHENMETTHSESCKIEENTKLEDEEEENVQVEPSEDILIVENESVVDGENTDSSSNDKLELQKEDDEVKGVELLASDSCEADALVDDKDSDETNLTTDVLTEQIDESILQNETQETTEESVITENGAMGTDNVQINEVQQDKLNETITPNQNDDVTFTVNEEPSQTSNNSSSAEILESTDSNNTIETAGEAQNVDDSKVTEDSTFESKDALELTPGDIGNNDNTDNGDSKILTPEMQNNDNMTSAVILDSIKDAQSVSSQEDTPPPSILPDAELSPGESTNTDEQLTPGDFTSSGEEEQKAECLNEMVKVNESSVSEINSAMLATKEGEYLTTVLGNALINALAEVSRMQLSLDPLTFLAVLLYRYLHMNELKNENQEDNTLTTVSRHRLLSARNVPPDVTALCGMKGSDGSTLVHYIAANDHELDGFFQLLCLVDFNLAERDGSYRTIRDVAHEKEKASNVEAINRYVFHLIRNGKVSLLKKIFFDGYDHLGDINDEEGNDAVMVAELNQQHELVEMFKNIQGFTAKVEQLHESVKNNDKDAVSKALTEEEELGQAKNTKGQTALHVAVLSENEDMVDLISRHCSASANIMDNMGRTPLHYAMGMDNPVPFAKILVQRGCNKLLRDANQHLPGYYFIDNREIQKLKNEMEQVTV